MNFDMMPNLDFFRKDITEIVLSILIASWLISLSADMIGYEFLGWILVLIFVIFYLGIIAEIEKLAELSQRWSSDVESSWIRNISFFFASAVILAFYPLISFYMGVPNVIQIVLKTVITLVGWCLFYYILVISISDRRQENVTAQ